jgi:endonuclease/exonuclease/phosphatase family metal-dependent hydrolase
VNRFQNAVCFNRFTVLIAVAEEYVGVLKFIFKFFGGAAVILAASFLAFLIWLTIVEYRPAEEENIPLARAGLRVPVPGDTIRILTWNIGYASLDVSQDFIMDGGTMVRPSTNANVNENIRGIRDFIFRTDWDVLFLQEVDVDSHRSYRVNQQAFIARDFDGSAAFAPNYRARFVPFPFPDFLGPVESGLLNLNRFAVREAARISLPVPFKWPVRTANLKRCLLVERVPIGTASPEGSADGAGRELVLVNLHLDAYTSVENRDIQTMVLVEFLEAEYAKGNYVIAGGDFNQNFPEINAARFALKDLKYFEPGTLREDMIGPRWHFARDPEIPTARLLNEPYSGSYEDTQLYVIDGFILSPNVELLSVHAFEAGFRYSDHNPVIVEALLH